MTQFTCIMSLEWYENEERSAVFKWMSRAVTALVCDAQARERERGGRGAGG